MPNLPLIKVRIVDYGADQAAIARYRRAGEERALRLGNRGPIQFDREGNLDREILDAYSRCGFYIFEGLLGEEELKDIERDVAEMLARAPDKRGATRHSEGRATRGGQREAAY